jgi:hypothetical protein
MDLDVVEAFLLRRFLQQESAFARGVEIPGALDHQDRHLDLQGVEPRLSRGIARLSEKASSSGNPLAARICSLKRCSESLSTSSRGAPGREAPPETGAIALTRGS